MIGKVKSFGHLLKIRQINTTDNVFMLHTNVTVALLLVFSVLLSAKEYFGNPIDCLTDNTKNLQQFSNNLCWTNGTFIFRNATGYVEKDYAIFQGVYAKSFGPKDIVYQKYYQWIALILIIQATLFYAPSYLWKILEGGLMKQLCINFDTCILNMDHTEEKIRLLTYFNYPFTRRILRKYAIYYFLCEILNLLVVIANILFLHVSIPGFWNNYASAIRALLSGNFSDWTKMVSQVFPKLAKCTVSDFGPSGSAQSRDALCLLQLNILNEKIFAVLWIWFIILLTVSALNILHLIVLIPWRNYRICVLRSRALLAISRKQTCKASFNGSIGYWFVLMQMSRNLNPGVFIEILSHLDINEKSHFID